MAATIERLRVANDPAVEGDPLPGGGLVVCALDTELLGHWWYEGVHWLQSGGGGVRDAGLEAHPARRSSRPAQIPRPLDDAEWGASTWGKDGDLSTWSGPAVADMAFATRAVELRTLAAGRDAGDVAVRELLALQASDWAFMVSRDLAGPYARERFEGHRERLERALEQGAEANGETAQHRAAGRREPAARSLTAGSVD